MTPLRFDRTEPLSVTPMTAAQLHILLQGKRTLEVSRRPRPPTRTPLSVAEVLQLFTGARKLLGLSLHFCVRSAAEDETGESCSPRDPRAVRWDAYGALGRVAAWDGLWATRRMTAAYECLLAASLVLHGSDPVAVGKGNGGHAATLATFDHVSATLGAVA